MVDLRTTEPRSLSFKELRHNVIKAFLLQRAKSMSMRRNKMGTWTKFYPGEQEQMMLTHQTKNEPFAYNTNTDNYRTQQLKF